MKDIVGERKDKRGPGTHSGEVCGAFRVCQGFFGEVLGCR